MGTGADAMTGMDDELPMRPRSRGTSYDAAGKTPSQIEEDMVATRMELGHIIGALEHKLAPGRLLESGVDTLKDAIGQNFHSQPLPLALFGLGVGWLLMFDGTRLRPSRPTPDADRSADYAVARTEAGGIRSNARVTPDVAGRALDRTSRRVMSQRPLVLGLLGLLAGATAALLLPRSKAEERLIGPAGTRWRETGSLGRQVDERARDYRAAS